MAGKIAFPNRPCPKCGKPIHVRTKSHDCGWKASPVASAPKAAAKPSSNGKAMSKMDAMRQMLQEMGNDAKPLDIQARLKQKLNIKMDPNVISNYKSTILRHSAKPKKKMGRPKMHAASMTKPSAGVNVSIDDIRAVKELAERLGADRLLQLVEVLGA